MPQQREQFWKSESVQPPNTAVIDEPKEGENIVGIKQLFLWDSEKAEKQLFNIAPWLQTMTQVNI